MLLKIKKTNNNSELPLVNTITKEIKDLFTYFKTSNVRRCIIPSNSKSLCNAAKKARDINSARKTKTNLRFHPSLSS